MAPNLSNSLIGEAAFNILRLQEQGVTIVTVLDCPIAEMRLGLVIINSIL
ncbi:MAG: hypothetical protein ACI8ZM_000059 [Crocinitomix sp.]|jgi:hypothetical protein